MRIRALELFAGIGGQALALKAAGVKTIGYCEIDDVNCDILRASMERSLAWVCAFWARERGFTVIRKATM